MNRLTPTLVSLLFATACTDAMDEPGDGADDMAEPDPGVVTLDIDGTPDLIAFQDGDGPWQVLTDDYTGHSDTGRFGVMVGCRRPTGTTLRRIIYQTTAEGSRLDLGAPCDSDEYARHVTGTMTGVTEDESPEIATPWDQAYAAHFELSAKPMATTVLALRYPADGPPQALRQDVDAGSGDAEIVVDLSTATPLREGQTDVGALGATESVYTATMIFAQDGYFFLPPTGAETSTAPYYLLPPASLRPDDAVEVQFTAQTNDPDALESTARTRWVQGDPGSTAIDLPSAVAFTAPRVDATGVAFDLPALAMAADQTLYGVLLGDDGALTIRASAGYADAITALEAANVGDFTAPRTGSWIISQYSLWTEASRFGSFGADPTRHAGADPVQRAGWPRKSWRQ